MHANVLRKHRIQFVTKLRRMSKHRKHEPVDLEPQIKQQHATMSHHPVVPSSSKIPSISISMVDTEKRLAVMSSSALTEAPTATDVDSHLDIRRYLTKQTPSKITNLTRIGRTQIYPRCPPVNEDGHLICPYCDDLLPLSYTTNESNWK